MASEEMERMKSEAELEQQYQMMRQQCQQLTYKINELKLDADEHDLVIEALKPLDKDRKCFRMVDAIVVERTVSDVLPAVQKNKDQVREPPAPLASDPPQPESPGTAKRAAPSHATWIAPATPAPPAQAATSPGPAPVSRLPARVAHPGEG